MAGLPFWNAVPVSAGSNVDGGVGEVGEAALFSSGTGAQWTRNSVQQSKSATMPRLNLKLNWGLYVWSIQ